MWTKRQKLQQTASQICPGGWGWEHDPKDSKQHINTAAGHWVWRVTGGSNEKALRLETSRKEPACRPGRNLGGGLWTRGLETQTRSPAAVGTDLPSAYLGCALVVKACLRVMENPKQERPRGRLKAKIRPLVSLPTAKPLSWFYPVTRNSKL